MQKNNSLFSEEYESKNKTQESVDLEQHEEVTEFTEEEIKYSISKPRREIIRAIIVHDKSKDR